tara:strand:+ start:508 stop:1107 length:600 start_codon:yes stop_codon:yes gene_type:complete
MSTLKVDTILKRTGTGTITVGQSGDTVSVPSGATLSVSGSTSGLPDSTPAFQAFRASNQTISASTYVKIEFETEDYDTDGCYNNTSGTVTLNGISTPSYSFAPNVAGKYLISGAVNANTSTDFDAFIVAIFKNGTQVNRVLNSNRHFDTAMTSFIVTANGTSDYFDIRGYTEQSGGSTLQATDSSSRLMWFCATRLIGV